MRDKLARFMAGRYGVDTLGRVTIGLALAFMILSMFFPKTPFYLVSLILLILTYFRMFSRNVSKRYQENQWFAKKFSGVRNWFARQKGYQSQKKTYHIFKCPSCKQKVRVPKGKGRISIHCPKCGMDFIKKS